MVAVRLEGRLGNQLFQYAFIYAAAKKLGVKFYIDQSIQPFLLDELFEVSRPPYYFLQKRIFSIKGYKILFSHYLKHAFYNSLKKVYRLHHVEFSNSVNPQEELKKLKDKIFYTGFFQSEQYFQGYKKDISNLFTVKNKYKQQYADIAKQFPKDKTIVVIHIRLSDYVDLNYHLPYEYYRKAIATANVTDPYYVLISDDPDTVEAEFANLDNKYVSRNPEIIDLQLLQHADVCILANSTFSWWGAWLNVKTSKQILAPAYWLGQNAGVELPKGITLSEWTLVYAN